MAAACVMLQLCMTGCANDNDYEIFGAVHGHITDYDTGQPLENASVVLSPTGQTQKTDAGGFYQFENLQVQQYTITVQKSGYQPDRKFFTAISGEDYQIDIQLKPIPQSVQAHN